MHNRDVVVDDERRAVALVSMPAIVASRIASFPQKSCHVPPHRITFTREGASTPLVTGHARLPWDGVLPLGDHHGSRSPLAGTHA
jgi:hypothetical protein